MPIELNPADPHHFDQNRDNENPPSNKNLTSSAALPAIQHAAKQVVHPYDVPLPEMIIPRVAPPLNVPAKPPTAPSHVDFYSEDMCEGNECSPSNKIANELVSKYIQQNFREEIGKQVDTIEKLTGQEKERVKIVMRNLFRMSHYAKQGLFHIDSFNVLNEQLKVKEEFPLFHPGQMMTYVTAVSNGLESPTS